MKATGVVRAIDDLGRIVIPKEIRRTMGINEKDPMEIFVNGDSIVLRKYAPGCILCGNVVGLRVLATNTRICESCITEVTHIRDSAPRS